MPSFAMVRDRLALGRAIPAGAIVTDDDWSAFERDEVTPRFPRGYTIDRVEGAWRDQSTGETIHEPTYVFEVAREDSADESAKVEAIACAYKSRFQQDAVMRSVEPVRVSFI